MSPVKTKTLIVGASAAGLSCAARLKHLRLDFRIIEKEQNVGSAWRNHYDRLHLHTDKSSSGLPFLKFPIKNPKYPSRRQVIDYLENYCSSLKIDPSFDRAALKIYGQDNHWVTETEHEKFTSQNLIMCMGNTSIPRTIEKEGLNSFPGKVIHSSEYKNGKEFSGQQVLVIGFGNSACEIAICLHEHGAHPALSVRSPVNVIPRDILGIPVLKIGKAQSKLSPKVADKLNKPLVNLLIGNIEKYGLRKLPYGPIEQIVKYQKVPLLDIGTMSLIKAGHIRVFGDINRIGDHTVYFENNQQQDFDAIIMATGYDHGLRKILSIKPEREADLRQKMEKRSYFGKENLYFCGYFVAPTGMLREIKLESKIIAEKIRENELNPNNY